MLHPIDLEPGPQVSLTVEGRSISAPLGANLAAVLLANGLRPFRISPADGSPRQAYCMMGVCFECLVEINGQPNQQSCLETVREGMVIRRQNGAARLQGMEAADV